MSNLLTWLQSDIPVTEAYLEKGGLKDAAADKPALDVLYGFYLQSFAPIRASSRAIGPLTDFVEVMRQYDKTALYTDEDWIKFLVKFTGDEDDARDLWDGLVCQP